MTSNNTNEYTSEQVNVQVSTPSVSSSQPIEGNNYEEVSPDVNEPIKDEPIITKKRRKTSAVWNNFEEIELENGTKKAMCLYCKEKLSTGGRGASTSHLEENVFIPTHPSSFCALEWWKDKSAKFKVLSKMAADILAVPISSVASESTFSAGGRVIDEYRASLNEQSIEALICGGDWLRNKYGLKKNRQVDMVEFGQEEIILKS